MNKETWIGKVVSFDSQADQVTGQGWGWRYKVRIMGDYSEQDGIEDRDVVYAMVMLPVTAGSGAREMMQTPRISQGDTVIGRFLAEDNQAPINTFLRDFISSRHLPVPITTHVKGSSAITTGNPVASLKVVSNSFSNAPPPVRTSPLSTISAASSGGVCSNAVFVASIKGSGAINTIVGSSTVFPSLSFK